jgi:hypothetical protein
MDNPYNHDKDVRGLKIRVGNERIESIEYSGRIKPSKLVEATRIINMEVQNCRIYNEKML